MSAVLDAYPDWQIPGHVITMVPTADRQKATVLVRIAFEALDPRILPDMGVKVTFLREEDEAAAPTAQPTKLVPKAAVQADDAGSYVFVIEPRRRRGAGATSSSNGARLPLAARTATEWRFWAPSGRAIGWWSRRRGSSIAGAKVVAQ